MTKRKSLTQAKVLAVTESLIEEKGLTELTLRDVADALSIRPQSVYNYVTSLAELLDLVGAEFVNEVTATVVQELVGVSGKEALLVFAHEFRQATRGHAELAPVLLDLNNRQSPQTHTALNRLYHSVFRPLQLENDDVCAGTTLYRSALFGFVVQETGGFFASLTSDEIDQRFDQVMLLAVATVVSE
ncbi:TetR/AcrR family transcriptional regulator [Lapidilactobacillus luobeiensis]|uniref:TetR/AcrR family transcriptional regulator n=1 Tax=Lapidilactobacillus luobeiensis TaxID=2950371 RepID=UPI0021C2BCCA|nr:TetR/AcrR family transcriptional regulator [Lapidilactobacillus luobeiensis]